MSAEFVIELLAVIVGVVILLAIYVFDWRRRL